MNFALLGGGPAILPLLRAIAADADHALRVAALVPEDFAEELLSAAPGVRFDPQWESLLNAKDVDAVIATAGDPLVETAVRQLAAAETPVLLLPSGDPTSALVYELALVRDDARVALTPMFPARHFVEFRALGDAIRDGRFGRVLDIQWTRDVPAATGLLALDQLHAALVHDVDALRQLVGEYDQVTAVYVGDCETGLSRGTVTLAGQGLPTATWSIRPATGSAGFELSVSAERGCALFRGELPAGAIPAGVPGLQTTGDAGMLAAMTTRTGNEASRAILEHFVAAIAGGNASPNWTDLMRSVEIVEAAERSVRRRRTIDLHFETTSERNQFKTQMTAIGCGLMSVTLIAVVFLLIAGALFNIHPVVMRVARIGVFVPLAVFLLLQLLLFLARPSSRDGGAGEPKTGDG
ncbi:MAG: hypothetical protein ACE5KM_17245 [Planctomycetaceae bacterium]